MIIPLEKQKKLLGEATRGYAAQIQGTPAEQYLLEERGFREEIVRQFWLGYVKEPIVGHEQYEGMIAIPYITRSGVVSIQFRSVPPAEKRYLFLDNDEPRPFNARVLMTARKIVITEGNFDCIAATQAGLQAVGFGSASITDPPWIRAFAFRECIILADGDPYNDRMGCRPGRKWAKEVAKRIDDVKIVEFEEGWDVNRFVKERGEEELRALIGVKL